MRRLKKEPEFKTEVELCAAFVEWLRRQHGWTPYAETAGWDILCVHEDGTQIGVQAKLKFNIQVLEQAAENLFAWNGTGPDYRAILVPRDQGSATLCGALGFTLLRPQRHWKTSQYEFQPDFSDRTYEFWHFCNPGKRHTVPEFVPDVPAGASSPVALTRWKVGALQICAVLELRGYVNRSDFRTAGIDYRRWREEWLDPIPERPGCWRWRDGARRFDTQHPVVYAQVLEQVRERGLAEDRQMKL